jgi:hypothetical protein
MPNINAVAGAAAQPSSLCFITQASPPSVSKPKMAAHSESDSSSLNTDEAVDDGNNFNVQNLNNGDGKTSDANGNDNQNANAVGDANVDQGDDNPNKDNEESERVDEESKANQDDPNNDKDESEREEEENKIIMETSPSTDEPKYTDMYARSLRGRRFLSNYIQGVPRKSLHCKRLTFDILRLSTPGKKRNIGPPI